MAPADPPDTHAYRQPIEAVLQAVGAHPRRGLAGDDARRRLERDGRNELAAEKRIPAWRKFLAQFQDVLVILLLVATAISAALWIYERDAALPYEAMAILAVVLLNASWATCRSRARNRPSRRCARCRRPQARVIRDGERRSIPAADVVRGDILVFEEGDTVPADARVIQSTALQTAEAALTGESLPVSKDTAPIADEAALGDRDNMVFSGTAATYGRGQAVVVATGMRTEMGRIAGMLQDAPDETTPLQQELDRVGKRWALSSSPSPS